MPYNLKRSDSMSSDYVERREDGYAVTGSRVSLDSIVYAFVSGESAESIAQAFPVLTLEQVYGAITFYLAHREEIDRYLELRRHELDTAREAARDSDPMFYQKLADAKTQTPLAR
jgi:uncharacterized protein (DUF433 family)